MRVGEVSFSAAALRSLSPDQVALLASITVLQESLASTDGISQAGVVHQELWTRQRRVERLREETILAAAGVSEADLEARYRDAPAWELEVRHLVLLAEPWQSAEVRANARRGAFQALQEIQRGEPFEEVAARWSEEPGAAPRGGLLRPGREGTWVRPFWDAALLLQEGQVSPVIETPFGFHVLRLERRRALPYGEARPRVVREVAARLGGGAAWEEAKENLLADLVIVSPAEAPRPRIESLFSLIPQGGAASHQGTVGLDRGGVLARWPGGVLTVRDFVHDLRGQPSREVMAARADPDHVERLLRQAAEQALLAAVADERRLHVPSEEIVAEMQRWTQRALEWVAVLGLEPGGPATARSERALAALRRTGQNANIARDQIREAAPSLLSALPLEIKNDLWQ
jgi:hypothetical protein